MINKLIIDAAKNKIFFMVIKDDNKYKITHENNKNNYERLALLINDFLRSHNLDFNKISQIYVNGGPGSFAGIRNSLAVVKALFVAKKIDYYCFSFDDFGNLESKKYENIPILCDKFKVKKNLIKPIYLS